MKLGASFSISALHKLQLVTYSISTRASSPGLQLVQCLNSVEEETKDASSA